MSKPGIGKEGRRSVAVVTVGRSDFAHYDTVLRGIGEADDLELRLMPTAAHFSEHYGRTIREIGIQGYAYEVGLETLLDTDSPQGMGKSIGLGVISFTQSFAQDQPDLLVVLGDRMEMICAPLAAIPFNIPVVHLYGGKVSEGAIDELVRHALTKMAHLHFVSCDEYKRRVLQMGEEEWRVHNVGAPTLDRMGAHRSAPRDKVCGEVGLDPKRKYLLVTYHPVTLERDEVRSQIDNLLEALEGFDLQVVFTFPNADVGSSDIVGAIGRYCAKHAQGTKMVQNAGNRFYLDLMQQAEVMVGNSSSGIVEAGSFALPVVNVGTRQAGAMRPKNVIDVGYGVEEIKAGISRSLSREFKNEVANMANPYGDGMAGQRIVEVLRTVEIGDRLLRKKFNDLR